jgi:hypothetical protein
MNSTVFHTPAAINAPTPALATTAPTMPPISACDELDGMPYHQVTMFQKIADQCAEHHMVVDHTGHHDALAHRGRHLELEDQDRQHVEESREGNRLLGLEHTRRDDGGDGIGGVVEAVHEVERHSQRDQHRDDPE